MLHRSFLHRVTVVPFPVDATAPHPSLGCHRPFPHACSIFPSPSEPQSSLPPWAAVVPFPVHASSFPPFSESPCALHGPVFLSRLNRSLHCRIPHWATAVASLVHVSLPLSIGPSSDDAVPSPHVQVSHRPHKPRQCSIVPTNPVNAASFLTLSPPPLVYHRPRTPSSMLLPPSTSPPPSTVAVPHRGSIIRCTVASLAHAP